MIRLLAILALVVAGCAAPESPRETPLPSGPIVIPSPTPNTSLDPRPARSAALEAAAGRWASTGITAYGYTVERICFCTDEYRGPFSVSVIAGEVFALTPDGAPVDDAIAKYFPFTAEALYELLRMNLDAAAFSVVYDEATGFPTTIALDRSTQIADEEVGFLITDFAPYGVDQ